MVVHADARVCLAPHHCLSKQPPLLIGVPPVCPLHGNEPAPDMAVLVLHVEDVLTFPTWVGTSEQ